MASNEKNSGKGKSTTFASAFENLEGLIQSYESFDNGKKIKPTPAGKTESKIKPNQPSTSSRPKGKPDKRPTRPNAETTGSSTALSSQKEKKEYFDTEEILSQKLDQLSQWIQDSKHFVVFTGAGISTSTGIPDFRSGMNTVLDTGPGVWELRAHGKSRPKEGAGSKTKVKSSLKAIPSKAHMAIAKLLETGHLKFVISQNTDGLHRRSGVHPDKLAELHGNTNKECCTKCGLAYMRDFRTRNATKVHDHKTGRFCDNSKCRGPLVDSIINFGEDLPLDELNKGFENGDKSDLCLVLGSSLRVTPAADIPAGVITHGGKLVICNLQKTPLNPICALEIHAKTDDVMSGVMQRLKLETPPFKLKRCVAMDTTSDREISFMGIDPDRGNPYSFLTNIKIILPKLKGQAMEFNKEPATMKLPKPLSSLIGESGLEAHVSLKFQGHYGEPDITLQYKVLKPGRNLRIIEFDPFKQQWELTNNDYNI